MQSIRVNTLRISPKELKAILEARYNVETVPWYSLALQVDVEKPAASIEYMRGFFYVQSLASMLPVIVLDPKPNEHILDLAAAPGSKATQISMHMQNTGILIANDNSYPRLKPLGGHFDRLGILNGVITNYDGRKFPRGILFHKILVDAPCSGLGSRHKHAPFSPNRLRQMEKTQKKLLIRAFDLLLPEGRLVYSTCTSREEENEQIIQHLLNKRETARTIKPELPVPSIYNIGARVELDEHFFIACIETVKINV